MWLSCICVVALCVSTCSTQEDLPWWKTALIYQVYPRSFMDTTGRGTGDIKGITRKAQHFKDIGLDAIWLNPLFASPMVDNGYDVSNFTAINPLFGTMDDVDDLLKTLKELGIKFLLDFVPNHTSDQHVWFQESVKGNPDYADFYVWKPARGRRDDGTPIPPNNWLSLFGGSAWEWREERGMFYLHQFYKQQPDLNFRNATVNEKMVEILNFWLDKGVDGFRMDAAKYIYEDAAFPDAAVISGNGTIYSQLAHNYDSNQPETLTLIRQWAELLANRTQQDGRERVIFTEVYDTHETVMQYYTLSTNGMVIPFNFDFVNLGDQGSRAPFFRTLIQSWLTDMPAGNVPNWVAGNHDFRRISDHYGPEMVDAINLLTGVLPGIKASYYGEEIGMAATYIRQDQIVDDSGFNRDPLRTPMQWDSSPSAGFSSSSITWLPVNPNYWWLNVEAQKSAPVSHLKVFQAMSTARRDPVLRRGDLKLLTPNDDTLLVVRQYNGSSFVLLINTGSRIMNYTSQNFFQTYSLDVDMMVVTGSIHSQYLTGVSMKQGSISISLRPKAALLLRSASDAVRAFMLVSLLALFVLTLTT